MLCGGTAGGVAAEIARGLAVGGAHVFVPAADIGAAGRTGDEASERIIRVEIESPQTGDGEAFVERLWRATGGLDAAVLAPEPPRGGSVLGTDLAAWRGELDRSLKAPFFLARGLGLRMAAEGQGCLVIVAVAPAALDQPAALARVTESGLVTMAQGLAKALPAAVRVNVLVAGGAEGAAAAVPGRTWVVELARLVRGLVLETPVPTGTVVRLGLGTAADGTAV